MATATVTTSHTFPEGTTVGVYPRTARNANGNGAPAGAQITSAAVTAGVLTFNGLVLNTKYTAYALVSGQHRYVDFSPRQSDLADSRERETGIRLVEASVDMPSLATVTGANVDVVLPAGSCRVGDGVTIVQGDDARDTRYVVHGDVKVIAADTVRLKVTNESGATVNPAAVNYVFAIFPK